VPVTLPSPAILVKNDPVILEYVAPSHAQGSGTVA
jgi:hypothetical protein